MSCVLAGSAAHGTEFTKLEPVAAPPAILRLLFALLSQYVQTQAYLSSGSVKENLGRREMGAYLKSVHSHFEIQRK
jgi:hypothetical protein